MKSKTSRIAIVLAGLFLIGAAVATFVPWSSDGYKCGNLVSPDWTEDQVDELVDGYRDLYESDFTGSYGGQAVGGAASARAAGRACDQSRSTRTIAAGSLAGLALVAPLGFLFVARGPREDGPADRELR